MPKAVLKIGELEVDALIAFSEDEQAKGLMFIDPPLPAMIFLYKKAQFNRFWMQNVKAALDIVFCRQGKVVDICYGEPFSTKLLGGLQQSDLVVELPYGTCKKFNIKMGAALQISVPHKLALQLLA